MFFQLLFNVTDHAVRDVCNTERGWAKRTLKMGFTSSSCGVEIFF